MPGCCSRRATPTAGAGPSSGCFRARAGRRQPGGRRALVPRGVQLGGRRRRHRAPLRASSPHTARAAADVNKPSPTYEKRASADGHAGCHGRNYGARHEGAAQLHGPAQPARRAARARDAGDEPALVVGRADPRPVPLGRSRRVGRHASTIPCACSGVGAARPARRAGRATRASCASSARCTTELTGYLVEAPLVPEPRPTGSPLRSVAYFSPEFGIAEALPQYSGGLGVLAGDHLKAASDLGRAARRRRAVLPARLLPPGARPSTAGSRSATPTSTRTRMALTLCDGVRGRGRPRRRSRCTAQVWRADVGRVPLYLLDADIDENPDDLRQVTDRLYGGDVEHRLRQEILLGIGGVRALRGARRSTPRCSTPTRATPASSASSASARLIVDDGLSYRRGHRGGAGRLRSSPPTRRCPAGIDRFPRELMEQLLQRLGRASAAFTLDDLMALGHRAGDAPDERFNMAVMGLRLAGRSNAVSKLHGEVSREMFADLWPDVPADEVPITSVTNGVHAQHVGVARDGRPARRATCCPSGTRPGPSAGSASTRRRDDEVWRATEQGRERLVAFVRRRLRESTLARGLSVSDVAWCDEVLDPKALTICFARRFATYKRATLLLSQPERLQGAAARRATGRCSSCSPARPTPPTTRGKEMIRQIVTVRRRARRPPPLRVPRGLRHRRRPRAVPGRRRVAEQRRAARRRRAARAG